MNKPSPNVIAAIVVAALGYFVDVYDLILFSVVRQKSLADLGIAADQQLSHGAFLLSIQMWGMLVGGLIWGVIGDKFGRLSVLFGSIILYSLANIANGFINDISYYPLLRFVAGVGLAGELGAGITLVSESLPKEYRGYGTTLVATVGMAGAITAAIVSKYIAWRHAFLLGGIMGLLLLLLRIAVAESGMFVQARAQAHVSRGNFLMLLTSRARFVRYLNCILIGLPVWFAVGVLITFAPEFGTTLQVQGSANAGDAVLYCYAGLFIGDLASGVLSQVLKSRRWPLAIFIVIALVGELFYLSCNGASLKVFYSYCFVIGLGVGYWAVLVTTAAEQFGTNLRATVATSVPNFVRGTLAPLLFLFSLLREQIGMLDAARALALACALIALIAVKCQSETYARSLDFIED